MNKWERLHRQAERYTMPALSIRRKCKARHRKTRHMETQISQYLRRNLAVRLCSKPTRRLSHGTAETRLSVDRSGWKYI